MTENFWICHWCDTRNDSGFINCKSCYKNILTIETIIQRIILNGDYKITSSNLVPSLRAKVDLLISVLHNENFKSYLKQKLISKEISIELLNKTLSEFVVSEDIINILMRQCPICLDYFPLSNMINMTSCSCEFCHICLKEWLNENIPTKPTTDWYCPSCPSRMTKIDRNIHFLSFRNLIDSDKKLKNLFHDKLRDEKLKSSKNFRWCPNEKCTNGFDIRNKKEPMIECEYCHSFVCLHCNVKWHRNETCEEYQFRTLKNDPDLMKVMKTIEIKCPRCQVQFDLVKGGCMHLKCKNCRIEFCSCCKKTFRQGKCLHRNCTNTGLHAHHPSNCQYFTRDNDINELNSILKKVEFHAPQKLNVKRCPTILTDKNYKDFKCNKNCYKNVGLCEDHYKEYLCLLIFSYDLDVSSISKRFIN